MSRKAHIANKEWANTLILQRDQELKLVRNKMEIKRITAQYIKGFSNLKDCIAFKMKLYKMDWCFYFLSLSGWALFPPSFYYTHTKEEVNFIIKETIDELRQMIEQPE